MGTQAMATEASNRQQSPVPSLARQRPLYSITLNEVQSHLGEPLHSMNLADLLKNVFVTDIENTATQYSSSWSQLERQGSIKMNRDLSKKTVDEIWRDIQQKKSNDGRNEPNLGEMTLEDFLMEAGVAAEDASDGNVEAGIASVGFAEGPHWLMYNEGQFGNSAQMVGAASDPQTSGRKRGAREEAVGEKTVERRQKRMIKNRESAARSRARKQAYTNELENKVSRLEEENERLRKQKELDTILCSAPLPEQNYQLRRLSSAPF